jgi:hypothetical protein
MEKGTQGWKVAWERSHQCVADVFARSEAGERSLSYLEGLRSGCERKKKLVGGGVGRGSFAFWDARTCWIVRVGTPMRFRPASASM